MSTLWNVVISNLYIITFCQKYIFVDEAISSLDADAECLSRYGTHLSSIHNVDDNTEAQSLCKSQPTDETRGCWIGLHIYNKSRRFKWYDGTPIDYQNWNTDRPNEYYQHVQDEYLVSILTDTGQWNDESSGKRLRLICWNSTKWNPSYDREMKRTEQISSTSSKLDIYTISIIIASMIIIFMICFIVIILKWCTCFSNNHSKWYTDNVGDESDIDNEGDMEILEVTSLHANKAYQQQLRISVMTGTTMPSLPSDMVDGPDNQGDEEGPTTVSMRVQTDLTLPALPPSNRLHPKPMRLSADSTNLTLPAAPPGELMKHKYSETTLKSKVTTLTDVTTTVTDVTTTCDNDTVTVHAWSVWKRLPKNVPNRQHMG